MCSAHRAPAARPRRRGAGDGRGAPRRGRCAGAAASSPAPATASKAICGSGVQNALLADAALHAAGAHARRGRAVRARAEPLRLLVVAPHHARERRPEPQLPRLQPAAAAQRGLRRAGARCWCRPTWPPTAEAEAALAAYAADARRSARCRRRSSGGQYEHPQGLFYGGRNPTWSQQTLRHVLRDHGRALRAAGLDRPAHRPRARAATASASSPAATTPRRWRAHAPGGAPQVTSIYDGSSASALLTGLMWLAALRGMRAGRVHRHRARIRHGADDEVIDALRADQWLREPPRSADAARRTRSSGRCATRSTPTPTRGSSASSNRARNQRTRPSPGWPAELLPDLEAAPRCPLSRQRSITDGLAAHHNQRAIE